MLQIPILKDIREYEAKQVGPFSGREVVCFTIGAVFAYSTFYMQKNILEVETVNAALCMITSTPALAFGWYKPYGLKLERFLKAAFISNWVSPKTRYYKTNRAFLNTEIKKLFYVEDEENDIENSSKKKKKEKVKKIKKSKNVKLYK